MTLRTKTVHTWTCDKCGKIETYEDGGQPYAWVSVQSAPVDFSQVHMGFSGLYHFCPDCRFNALAAIRAYCAAPRVEVQP